MERLRQDLFRDRDLEVNEKRAAGAVFQPAPCATFPGGGSACITGGGADIVNDVPR